MIIGIWQLAGIISTVYALGAEYGWNPVKMYEGVKKALALFIVEHAAEYAGLNLDAADPLSDASFSRAISERVGFTIRTLKDRESLEVDFAEAAADKIYDRSGIRFTNLRSREQITRDMVDFGVKKIAGESGLVLTDPLNPEALKADVLAWGKEMVLAELGEDVLTAISAEWSNGVSLLALMKQATGRDVSARELMTGLNSVLMKHYAEKMDRFNVATKADKRRLQNKLNQRAFRDRHRKGTPGYDGKGVPVYIPLSSRGG